MKFLSSLLLFLALSSLSYSQDDLMSMFDDEEETTNYTTASFKATKVILGQSVENVKNGNLNFMVQHQFGSVKGGAYELWGMDQASIRLGFEYGITDWLNVGIGRSSYNKTFDGMTKIRLLRQSSGKKVMPITLSYYGGAFYNSLEWSDPERENYESSRYSFVHQLLIARKFSDRFTLQVSPTLVHRNLVSTKEEEHDVISIAPAFRFKINQRLSVNAEYFFLLPGHTADNFENAFNIGVDIETGGHVFQLYFTNAQAIQEPYFIAQTTGKWEKSEFRLAFNLYRTFVIKRPKSFQE